METIAITRETLIDYTRNMTDIHAKVDIDCTLAKLDRTRKVLVYLHVAGYSVAELANAFELPEKDIKEYLVSAMLLIGEELGLRDTKLYRYFDTTDRLWQGRKSRMIAFFRRYTDELCNLEEVHLE